MREREELLNQIDQVPLFVEKEKVRKTPSEEIFEEFERDFGRSKPFEGRSGETIKEEEGDGEK